MPSQAHHPSHAPHSLGPAQHLVRLRGVHCSLPAPCVQGLGESRNLEIRRTLYRSLNLARKNMYADLGLRGAPSGFFARLRLGGGFLAAAAAPAAAAAAPAACTYASCSAAASGSAGWPGLASAAASARGLCASGCSTRRRLDMCPIMGHGLGEVWRAGVGHRLQQIQDLCCLLLHTDMRHPLVCKQPDHMQTSTAGNGAIVLTQIPDAPCLRGWSGRGWCSGCKGLPAAAGLWSGAGCAEYPCAVHAVHKSWLLRDARFIRYTEGLLPGHGPLCRQNRRHVNDRSMDAKTGGLVHSGSLYLQSIM